MPRIELQEQNEIDMHYGTMNRETNIYAFYSVLKKCNGTFLWNVNSGKIVELEKKKRKNKTETIIIILSQIEIIIRT